MKRTGLIAVRSLQPNAASAAYTMPLRTATLPPGEPDPVLVEKLAVVQQGCLGVVALIALTVFTCWIYPPFALTKRI